MEKLTCVVHYKNSSSTYSKIKSLSDTNIKNLREAKLKREQIKGENYHEEQFLLLPENPDETKHWGSFISLL